MAPATWHSVAIDAPELRNNTNIMLQFNQKFPISLNFKQDL